MESRTQGAIYCKSCESMEELEDQCVALTVTSPPYWNAIDYDRHTKDPASFYRTRTYSEGYSGYNEYLAWMERISGEILRVTQEGGFLAFVVGTVLFKRKHYPVPFHLTSRLTSIGWEFHQDIVWHKVTGGVKRAGVFLQHPYPGYYYPNIMTEYILVFRKPGPGRLRRLRANLPAMMPLSELVSARLFTDEIANNVWHIAPVPPGTIDHPCPFPEEIPYRLISLYSWPGDLILDPFCGSGQTLKVARYLGRRFVGYDISPRYVELAKRRLEEDPHLREKQLIAIFDHTDASAKRGPRKKGNPTRYGKRKIVAQDG